MLVLAPTSLQAFRNATSAAVASTTAPTCVYVKRSRRSNLRGRPKQG